MPRWLSLGNTKNLKIYVDKPVAFHRYIIVERENVRSVFPLYAIGEKRMGEVVALKTLLRTRSLCDSS